MLRRPDEPGPMWRASVCKRLLGVGALHCRRQNRVSRSQRNAHEALVASRFRLPRTCAEAARAVAGEGACAWDGLRANEMGLRIAPRATTCWHKEEEA